MRDRYPSSNRTMISRIFNKSIFFGNGTFLEVSYTLSRIRHSTSHTFIVGNPSQRRHVKLPLHFTQHILGHFTAQNRQQMPLKRNIDPEQCQRPVKRLTGEDRRSQEMQKKGQSMRTNRSRITLLKEDAQTTT